LVLTVSAAIPADYIPSPEVSFLHNMCENGEKHYVQFEEIDVAVCSSILTLFYGHSTES
jgi:hypothetical protein